MKRKVLTVILCMTVTLSTVLETSVSVHAAGNQNVPVNEATAEGGTAQGGETEGGDTTTEDAVKDKENETATGETETGDDGESGASSQESLEEKEPENSTPGEVPEAGTPQDAVPNETPEQPEAEMMAEEVSEENDGEKWWSKVEAESGTMAGNAKAETPGNLGGQTTVVGYLDQGEANSVTITVKVAFTDDVQMKVRYRSGENRDLCYKVNDGEEKKWTDLNSGAWETMADTSENTISLQEGENKIKFYAPEGKNGPGIDYITFSRNGGTEEDMVGKEEMAVEFKVGDESVKTLTKPMNGTIEESDLPAIPEEPEGQDFLGWFWGNQSKYEGIFPLNLEEIDKKVLDGLGGNMTLTARFGKHTPANSKEKDGYRLIFDEDFDGTSLNETNWVDRYLSSWSTTADYTKGRSFNNGIMSLEITKETQPWCVEFDGQTVISGFTTGQRNGLHNWNGNNKVRNPEDTKLTHINQYGYYEMRMKGQSGSSRHSAWWLLGFEDVQEESAEIDIFEVLGQNDHEVPPAVHEWKDTDAFQGKPTAHTDSSKDFNNEYHVYGFDWQQGTSGDEAYPDKIVFYIDGEKYSEKNVNIDYPMIQLLSLYEKRAGGWTGAWEWMPYPNTMDVDYVRVYKKLPSGAVAKNNLEVTEIKAEDLNITENNIALKQYENGYTEKNLPGTKSYVRVTWNDGVETQEPVVWEPITETDIAQLKEGKSIEKTGTVNIKSIPGTQLTKTTSMTITPEEAPPPPPYSVEGATALNDTGNLFDGKADDPTAQSAEFKTTAEDMASGKVAITYNFEKDVVLSGIDMWTNFGQKQGIKSFNVAVWDNEAENWTVLKDDAGQEQLFTLDWKMDEEAQEKQSVSFNPVTTSKVKIIVKDAGLTWNSKFAMREIKFNTQEAEAVLESLEVTPPAKTEYAVGEELNLEGMVVTGHYSDGTTKEIPVKDVIVTGYDNNKIGKQMITVTYKDDKMTATFEIEVKKGQAGVNKAPSIQAKDVVLTVGDKFDPMKGVTASDAEDGDLTKDIKVEENTVDTGKAGVYKVVYKVTDKGGAVARKTVKVTVKDKDTEKPEKPVLESLTVTPPAKTEYVEGEELNLEGMVVTGHYSDGTTKEIPVKDVIVTGYDNNKIGKQMITVTYKDNKMTATFEIEVKKGQAGVNKAPSIQAKDVVLTVGDKFDPMKGVTASDAEDGDLTKDIKVEENTVKTSKAGVYKVVYKVTDKDGAVARKTIKVTVKEKEAGKNTGTTSSKSVKTADTTNLVLWAMLIVVSGLTVLVLFRKRRKR